MAVGRVEKGGNAHNDNITKIDVVFFDESGNFGSMGQFVFIIGFYGRRAKSKKGRWRNMK